MNKPKKKGKTNNNPEPVYADPDKKGARGKWSNNTLGVTVIKLWIAFKIKLILPEASSAYIMV